ncbi:unnamed protein product [Brugia timori]|uniref:Uncharacterized protein n=1 Tax=Brugia timori TaxID=42155 RepID=A0A0R3QS60_9BILA|nr:unnamed protein product [Brugia timori]
MTILTNPADEDDDDDDDGAGGGGGVSRTYQQKTVDDPFPPDC